MRRKALIPILAMAAISGFIGGAGSTVTPAHAGADGQRPRGSLAQAVPVQPNPARIQQKMRQIEPEYRRRVLRDGKAVADDWLVRTARQWGIEEGRRARREYDANQRRAAEAANRAKAPRPPVNPEAAATVKPAPAQAPASPVPVRQGLR